MSGMTSCEKILARASGQDSIRPGDIIDARPDVAMSHDNTVLVYRAFKEAGAERIANRESIVVVLDHRAPANTVNSANNQSAVRKIVGELGISRFYDIGTGICHQILVEKEIAKAGILIVGTDSHSTTYGAVGAMGVGVGATDMASVWVKGVLWLKVPESIKVRISGSPLKGVFAKDISLAIVSKFGAMGADYCCLEFHGDYVSASSLSDRMTLCNMAAECGAKGAIVPQVVLPDPNSRYSEEIAIEADRIGPLVSLPHSVDKVAQVTSGRRHAGGPGIPGIMR